MLGFGSIIIHKWSKHGGGGGMDGINHTPYIVATTGVTVLLKIHCEALQILDRGN